MNLKKIGKVLTSKSVGTGPWSHEKKNLRAAVSQRLRNTDVDDLPVTMQLRTRFPRGCGHKGKLSSQMGPEGL